MFEEYEILKTLFVTETYTAIQNCKQIISTVSNFDSFEEFFSYHLEHAHISTCQKEWSTPRMSIHCFDCSLNDSSCVCLECFLKSKHEGHNYMVQPDTVGNCDCGDTSLMKKQGFCKDHQGLDEEGSHPQDYLDETLQKTLTDYIFKAAFAAIKILAETKDSRSSNAIIQFISSFLKFGDGFRRLIVIALTERIDFKDLLRNITKYSYDFNQSMQKMCGKLINDFVFKNNFSRILYEIILDDILEEEFKALFGTRTNNNYAIWNSFWFHSFSPQQIQYNIVHYNWDWVSFMIKLCTMLKYFFKLTDNNQNGQLYPRIIPEIVYSISSATDAQPNEQTQSFFDRLFTEVLKYGTEEGKNDTTVAVSFKDFFDEGVYSSIIHFNHNFYDIFKCFKSKKNLKFETLIDQLDESVDISKLYCIGKNENEGDNYKFILKYNVNSLNEENEFDDENASHVHPYYYRSLHNGASLFFSLPLYKSFANLFTLDNYCRVKIARLLAQEKYQGLRIRLAINTLRTILGMVCYHESLVPNNNFGLVYYVRNLVSSPRIATSGISLYFPLLQLLIGLKCNESKTSQNEENNNDDNEFGLKEFFAYEMAREIGLFDDISTPDYQYENIQEKHKQMMFTFMYYSILLVIERVLFNYNDSSFLREQLISALKEGVSTLDELAKFCDRKATLPFGKVQVPIQILSPISTTRKSKGKASSIYSGDEEVKYELKEGVEWTSISAINTLSSQKMLLNNEISKNKETLLKIPEFQPEETSFFCPPKNVDQKSIENEGYDIDSSDLHIQLKEFLLTPTVIAIVYHCLRRSIDDDSRSVELNDHLAMNILLLISKFAKEKDNVKNLPVIDDTAVFIYNRLPDLIKQLEINLFNYKVDKEGNASIQNTLNSANFNALLRIKISFAESEPVSLIDILLNKGKIGKDVLSQLSIIVDGENAGKKEKEEDIKLINKQRARKMKEDMMNHFKNLISNFNTNENVQDEGDEPQENNEANNNNDKEICSICSTTKANEILSYPIYIYHTKFPFIIDKPPFFTNEVDNNKTENNNNENDVENESEDEDESADKEQNDKEIEIENEKIDQQQNLIVIFKNEADNDSSHSSEEEIIHKLKIVKCLQSQLLGRIGRNVNCLIRAPISSLYKDDENDIINNNNNDDDDDDDSNDENENNNDNDENENNNDENENENNNVENENNNDNVENEDENENENENNNENENVGGNNIENENEDENNNDNDNDEHEESENDNENNNNNNDDDEIVIHEIEDEPDNGEILNALVFHNNRNIPRQKKAKNSKFPGVNYVIQFGICQHLVHPDCVKRKGFRCPIDRSIKNGFLPCLDCLQKENIMKDPESTEININTLKFEVVHSVIHFTFCIYSFFKYNSSGQFDFFVELVKSLSGLISTYEIRLRNLLDCLDSKKNKFLARNLFLSVWYAYRIFGKPRMLELNVKVKGDKTIVRPRSIEKKMTIFQKFILKLVDCDKIENDTENSFKSIVNQFVNSSYFNPEVNDSNSVNLKKRKKELCLFLRRVCLADYFLLRNKFSSDLVDWDEVLSLPNLFERYDVKFTQVNDDEFEFKPFIFTKLPKQFLHFSQKPYSFPIELTQDNTLFNLLDYNYLIENFDDFDDCKDESTNQVKELDIQKQLFCFGEENEQYLLLTSLGTKKYPSIFLYIGRNASKVIALYQNFQVTLKPFYIDKNGYPDFGYRRNQPLFLKEERFERFMDEILSGDFINSLEPLIRLPF